MLPQFTCVQNIPQADPPRAGRYIVKLLVGCIDDRFVMQFSRRVAIPHLTALYNADTMLKIQATALCSQLCNAEMCAASPPPVPLPRFSLAPPRSSASVPLTRTCRRPTGLSASRPRPNACHFCEHPLFPGEHSARVVPFVLPHNSPRTQRLLLCRPPHETAAAEEQQVPLSRHPE